MDRSDTPTLLLPLLALLAVAFPFAMYRTPAPAGGNNPQAVQTSEKKADQGTEENKPVLPPHSAAKLVDDFLQASAGGECQPDGDPRNCYSLDFMIAIAADPIDSRLPRMFDSSVDSIQRAFEADGYVLDRFDLAWSEAAATKTETGATTTSGNGTKIKLKEEIPRYRRLPSLLLFRSPPDPDDMCSTGKLFLVFLVGETPTSGIHKAAMASALHQLASFYKWDPGHKKLPSRLWNLAKDDLKSPLKIRIMGPSFSGSATSLEFALRNWLAGLPKDARARVKLQIVSGSATAIDPTEFCKLHAGGPHTFQAVVPPDDAVMKRIYGYIGSLGRGRAYKRIALLAEGGTAYGQATIQRRDDNGQEKAEKETACKQEITENKKKPNKCEEGKEPEVINLPFPLHISELRTATAKQRESQQPSNSSLPNNLTSWVHLNEEQSSQPKETPPSFSSLEASSSELVLSRLLSTISHEGIHAVGIFATDVRDVLFLAREIHRHCPGTLVFTVFSDLLFSHPDVITSTKGMLVFSPYPLYNLNQVWTPPFLGLGNRFQFRSQDAEGAYNATLALLGRKDLLLDYGEPFSSAPAKKDEYAKPALWVTVVGRNGPLPVKTLCWNDSENYSVHVKPEDLAKHKQERPEPPKLDEEGIYTANTTIGIVLLTAIFIVLSVVIIRRYHLPSNLEQEEGAIWHSRIFGEPVTPEYRRQARLFLFAALVCLLCAYIVLVAVYSMPVVASLRLGAVPPLSHTLWWTGFLLVSILIAVGLLSLAAAVVVVNSVFRKDRHQDHALQGEVKFVVHWACLLAFSLASGVAIVWLYTAFANPLEGISTYVRTFQFFSGLSPLVPLFCVALAGFLWARCSFCRLRMIDGIRPTSRESCSEEYVLVADTPSFKGVEALGIKVRRRLENASAFSRRIYFGLVSAGALAAMYLLFSPFVPFYEGLRFYFLFGWGFLLVFAGLTTEFARLCLTWAAFRHLLQRLAVHPMMKAYGRYRESFKGLHRIDLAMPLQTFSVLEFSVDQAERLLRMASSLASSRDLSGNQRQNLNNWILDTQEEVSSAAKNFSKALDEDASGNWRLAIEERSRAQSALGTLTQTTAELLEPSWRAAKNAPSLSKEPPEFQEFRRLGEEFLAGRVVLLISYVLPTLRKLGTFILIGLLLMFASVMFYPFVQKNHFLAFNWVVILGFVVLALVVMLQMEHDVVLSALNGTTPGQVKITRQFTFRILTYVMVPILLLLSAQFPDTFGWVISLFSRFQGH